MALAFALKAGPALGPLTNMPRLPPDLPLLCSHRTMALLGKKRGGAFSWVVLWYLKIIYLTFYLLDTPPCLPTLCHGQPCPCRYAALLALLTLLAPLALGALD